MPPSNQLRVTFSSRFDMMARFDQSDEGQRAKLSSWARLCTTRYGDHVLSEDQAQFPERYPTDEHGVLAFDEFGTFLDVHACHYVTAVCREEARTAFPRLFDGHTDENGNHYPSLFEDPRVVFVAKQDPRHHLGDKQMALVQKGDTVSLYNREISLPPSRSALRMGRWVADLVLLSNSAPARVFELGVGSGLIMASAIKALDDVPVEYVASDIDDRCLTLSGVNMVLNDLDSASFKLKQGNGFEPMRHEEPVDIIVCNPPYFTTSEANGRGHVGPALALDGGRDGLDFYRMIFNEGPKHLKNNGKILVQVCKGNIEHVQRLAREKFGSRAKVSVLRMGGKHVRQHTKRGKAVLVELGDANVYLGG